MASISVRGQVALVTGATRGVGRGVASALREAGAIVYATGRTILHADLDPSIIRIRCDHNDDANVRRVFERIESEQGTLHILVNNAWGGYEHMVDGEGRFTWALPFWQQPRWRWSRMMDAGVRAAFVATQYAAPMMIRAKRGLIVNMSFWAAQKYLGNVIYGVSKAATDKLTADTGHELAAHHVTVVSMYPGLVATELVRAAGVFDLAQAESPEFVGRAVAALASDPGVQRRSGQVVIAAALAREYGFTDVDGRMPPLLTLADV